MNAVLPAALGTPCLLVAGFVQGSEHASADPDFVFAAAYGFGGLGVVGVVAAGVSIGIRMARR